MAHSGPQAFTAKLCGLDGAEAGAGPCVRPTGHPVGGKEYHRDARRNEFYNDVKCPLCEAICEEGPTLAEHVRVEHGGVPTPVDDAQVQLGLFGSKEGE